MAESGPSPAVGLKSETGQGDSKKADAKTDLISRRAEIFRAKLVHEFSLLEAFGDEGEMRHSDQPTLTTKDVIDENLSRAMLTADPSALILFSQYSQRKVGLIIIIIMVPALLNT